MLFHTHLVISVFLGLVFLGNFENAVLFLMVVVVSGLIPDIDSKMSILGRYKIFRIPQFFIVHRGILHSLTFLVFAGVLLLFLFRIEEVYFGFIIGYSGHLVSDAVTRGGIMPFYPIKKKIKGFISVGNFIESVVFVLFLILCVWKIFVLFNLV